MKNWKKINWLVVFFMCCAWNWNAFADSANSSSEFDRLIEHALAEKVSIDQIREYYGEGSGSDSYNGRSGGDKGLVIPRRFLEINLGQSSAGVEYGETTSVGVPMIVYYGGDFQFKTDEYLLFGGNITYGAEMSKNVNLMIGVKGVLGSMEEKGNDGNILAVGLLATFDFDSRSTSGIPFEVTARICLAPDTVSFLDANEYLEFRSTIGMHIFTERRGTVFVGYRNIQITYDNDDYKVSDGSFLLGFRYRF